jgi:uracil-DNA glycosylase
MKLRKKLHALFGSWRDDVDTRWLDVLDGIEPNFTGVADHLELNDDEIVFPGRRGQAPQGARSDSHIFRAFEGIAPKDVTVVVMGQDPYQRVAQATGRAFEQGDLRDWFGQPRVAPSLKRIIQAVATERSGDPSYVAGADAGWTRLVADLESGGTAVPPPHDLWNRWQDQGVLFFNAIFTFNRADPDFQFDGHAPLWAPIVRGILGHVVRRKNRPVVFVSWGDKAVKAFRASGAEMAARDEGTWEKTVTWVRRPHPNAQPINDPPFLKGENPFRQINEALNRVGGERIDW